MALPFSLVFAAPRISRLGVAGRFLIHTSATLSSAAPTPDKTAASKTSPAQDLAGYMQKAEDLANKYTKHVDEAVSRWAKSNEVYYGKERDMKNFPPVKYPLSHPKVRFGFIPDSWFQALYPKTGVTGPYLFMFGSLTFLLSKEIWVVDAHFVELMSFLIIVPWLIKKLSPYARKYVDAQVEELEQDRYYKPLKALTENLDRTVSTADEEIARETAVPLLVQAKEENLALQLEAAYRERLQQVHRAVTRRLDYHVERENARVRFQQQHMINWVVNHVVKGITPAQEKETLSQCIGELKRLAKVYKAAPAI
ncbi:unnamed protein product [Calicophoron daubneyi]|uniref:ATP synthase subunit b n=1 Tax=Calicophoron daubneyi TaxID=300641 RepID=A0AAV2TI84_CALDB